MASVLAFWREHKGFLQEKNVQQIIALCGDGRLRDGSAASAEFRELLDHISSRTLARYAKECLQSSFDNSGLVLQDLVNQLGIRIGFQVEHGLYRGRVNKVGWDGLWSSADGYRFVVEVKTTDTYRINLDTLAGYRSALIEQNRIQREGSSILIVVGRQDTGDLEAQIRGSQHAWDIRLISVEALLQLMAVKESLSDAKTAQQISEVLKPQEYTRLDRLINVIFSTSEDLQAETPTGDEPVEAPIGVSDKAPPAKFHDECIETASEFLRTSLIKEGRNRYTNPDKSIGISCAVSKEYPKPIESEYWFAFHPSQREYLQSKQRGYVCYGCGSPQNVVLIPFEVFEPLLGNMWSTTNEARHYWHIHIFQTNGRIYLGQGTRERIDITRYHLSEKYE